MSGGTTGSRHVIIQEHELQSQLETGETYWKTINTRLITRQWSRQSDLNRNCSCSHRHRRLRETFACNVYKFMTDDSNRRRQDVKEHNHGQFMTKATSSNWFLLFLMISNAFKIVHASTAENPPPSSPTTPLPQIVTDPNSFIYISPKISPPKKKIPKLPARPIREEHDSTSKIKGSITLDFGNQKAQVLNRGPLRRLKRLGSRTVDRVRQSAPYRRILKGPNNPNQIISTTAGNKSEIISTTTSSSSSLATTRILNDEVGSAKQQLQVTLTPETLLPLALILIRASSTTLTAFVGTLRLLAPMLVARKTLLVIGDIGCDYLRGRYFRTTYTRLERAYLRYYEAPAALRAIARVTSQIIIFVILQKAMGWMVGTNHPPCRAEHRGLAFLCGTLWIFSVVGMGHAFATYIARWGGPLRVQAATQSTSQGNTDSSSKVSKSLLRQVLVWMQDPQQWLRAILLDHSHAPESMYHVVDRNLPNDYINNGEEFKPPNPLIFPITWGPLRLMQMFALAKIFMTEPPGMDSQVVHATASLCQAIILPELPPIPNMTGEEFTSAAGAAAPIFITSPPHASSTINAVERLMRLFLIQLSLGDEWCRVFLEEKRMGLGIVVVAVYFLSLVNFVVQAASFLVHNSSSSTLDKNSNRSEVVTLICLFPSVMATIVTAWMNVVFFWNRMNLKRKREAIRGFEETKKKMMKVLTLQPPMY